MLVIAVHGPVNPSPRAATRNVYYLTTLHFQWIKIPSNEGRERKKTRRSGLKEGFPLVEYQREHQYPKGIRNGYLALQGYRAQSYCHSDMSPV